MEGQASVMSKMFYVCRASFHPQGETVPSARRMHGLVSNEISGRWPEGELQLGVKMQAGTPKEGVVLRYSEVAQAFLIKSRPPGQRVWLEKRAQIRLQPQDTFVHVGD